MVSEDESESAQSSRGQKGRTGEEQGTGVTRPARDRTRDPALFVPGTLILWSDGWFGVEGGHGGASRFPSVSPPHPPLGPRCLV